MHYHAEIWISRNVDVDEQIEKIMLPFGEEAHPRKGWWDWYQIGGRWTGSHRGYDPTKDPANLEPTGKTKWPTQWARHEGDVVSVPGISEKLECYTLVVGKKVFHRREWDGSHFIDTGFDGRVKAQLDKLGVESGYIVTVDYHD